MNQQITTIQKNLDKTFENVSDKLDIPSFQSAKESVEHVAMQGRENAQGMSDSLRRASESAAKAASQAVRDGLDQSQRLNEGVAKQASSRAKEYSGFVKEHPISATVAALFVGFTIARWMR